MFGWIDFGEDGKKKVRNMGENGWEGCLVGREKGGRELVRLRTTLHPPKLHLPK